ncbi:MAG: Ku protein [Acidimicrobiales bacterium]
MARAIWTGSISFGLVNIPVGLYSAVSEKTIRFHQLERGTSDRVRYKRVNESTGKEVEYQDIVKGYDIGGDQYVIVTPKELEAVEPSGSRTIEIDDFVAQSEIDPIFYDQTYYVAPKTDAASRPYALLLHAMQEAGKVAIASFVMRSKEHLAALRVDGEVLALETMFFADEIRDPRKELDTLPDLSPPKERELSTAISLIESMSTEWEPEKYHDRYRARVEDLIEKKTKGEEIVTGRQPQRDDNVVDLMEALSRSVDKVKEEKRAPVSSSARNSQEKVAAKAHENGSAKAKGRSKKSASEQLSLMSREELYQLAQNLELPGRSKMSRDELEQAVAGAKARRRAS